MLCMSRCGIGDMHCMSRCAIGDMHCMRRCGIGDMHCMNRCGIGDMHCMSRCGIEDMHCMSRCGIVDMHCMSSVNTNSKYKEDNFTDSIAVNCFKKYDYTQSISAMKHTHVNLAPLLPSTHPSPQSG